ncbi:LysR substrate-binding domain-containing protein [Hoyosella subflava]|uniref:Putative LysR-family transcriptional regulator n=1 Tax=Hoyosella subflava (strain DSM 45089 / JCM 17490 / NBRC 109087 / DQS3-9A1) TaxID=443218 RepID=F6ES82_HOYSD|nr:LysR substrate-binding domain-containing protein [Hoyosella subflava]AEF42086.1 Putative LysR-family transcriptional regulator [Hoyosella subflava DQS3-9A1]
MRLPPQTPRLDVLDLLVSVAELGSLGLAARERGISQPAASMRIRALEAQLRLVLLERSPTGSKLTPAGAAVVEWAIPVLDAARALVAGASALHGHQRTSLRIAASMTIADHRIPSWLLALHRELPDTSVALRVGNSHQVMELVHNRDVDLGFVEGPSVADGLEARVVGEDELIAVVAPGHAWAVRSGPLDIQEVAATPLLLREKGSGTREAVWDVLRRVGDPPAPAAELGSTAAIKAAARAGVAPAVLSRLSVEEELKDGSLVSVALSDSSVLRREFRAIWRRGARPTGVNAALMNIAVRS